MRLRMLTTSAVLLFTVSALSQNQDRSDLPAISYNWGAKMGFSATATYVTDAYIEGHKLTSYTQDTQVGNFLSLIARLSSRSFFIQSGLGFNYNKSCVYIDKNSWNPESGSVNDFSCQFSLKSITLPIQLGYHIVNRQPYCMSVFTGPRLRFTPDNYYSVEFHNLDPYQFTEKPTEIIMGWTGGLSVKIGRTFIDFEYEATVNTVSGPMTDMSETTPAPDYRLNRRLGIMSFSYGIIF